MGIVVRRKNLEGKVLQRRVRRESRGHGAVNHFIKLRHNFNLVEQ
jgi:hypothetical protein